MRKRKHTPPSRAIADLSTDALASRVTTITTHLDAIDALLSGGSPLTTVERKHALRLQGDEEVDALRGVLDFTDARAELFVDLADEDHGLDPTRFETALLRSRLDNAQLMAKLAARVARTQTTCSDNALYLATVAKGPTLAAYAIAKHYVKRDRKNGKRVVAAFNLYQRHARAGAKARAAKQASRSNAR
jgi:hypothetical protein